MYSSDDEGEAVSFNEFVGLARDEGLVALDVQVVQAPNESNRRTAIVHAIARTNGGSFGAIGEASPQSAPEAWHPFLTTLAELRAKARALRELTGQEHAVREELAVPYLTAPGEVDEPAARPLPGYQRPTTPVASAASIRSQPQPYSAAPAPQPPSRPGEDDDEEDGEDGGDEDTLTEMPVAQVAAAPVSAPPAGETAQEYDSITPDMVAKLKKLATSLAALDGAELSDSEATQRLNEFFIKAFRHPLNRASRIEGQRVVQKLSSDLSKRRANPAERE